MKRIMLPKYLSTTKKGVYIDLEVSYDEERDRQNKPIIYVDEVFCYDGNITDLLSTQAKLNIETTIKDIIVQETNEARIALKEDNL